MANFPNSVYAPRTKQNKAGVVYHPEISTTLYAEDITKLDDEVVAVETEVETYKNELITKKLTLKNFVMTAAPLVHDDINYDYGESGAAILNDKATVEIMLTTVPVVVASADGLNDWGVCLLHETTDIRITVYFKNADFIGGVNPHPGTGDDDYLDTWAVAHGGIPYLTIDYFHKSIWVAASGSYTWTNPDAKSIVSGYTDPPTFTNEVLAVLNVKNDYPSGFFACLDAGLTLGVSGAYKRLKVGNITLLDLTTPTSPERGQIYFSDPYFLGWNGSSWVQFGFGLPGGSDKQIQFNDGSALNGDTGLTFDKSTKAVGMSGKITKYNDIATEGHGVPAIVDEVTLTGQNTNIGSTNFTNANVPGLYRLSYYGVTEVGDPAAGAITLTVSWNDGIAGHTQTLYTLQLSGTGGSGSSQFVMLLGSGSVSWQIGHTGSFGSSFYGMHMALEKLI